MGRWNIKHYWNLCKGGADEESKDIFSRLVCQAGTQRDVAEKKAKEGNEVVRLDAAKKERDS